MPIYEPKILFNPTDEVVEVRSGGKLFIFGPKEKKNLEGFPAWQILNHQKTPLVEFDFTKEVEVKEDSIDYEKMPWRKLVSIASKAGVFKTGMGREQVISLLKK